MIINKGIKLFFACGLAACSLQSGAQSFTWYSSTEGDTWKTSVVKMSKKAAEANVTVERTQSPLWSSKIGARRSMSWIGMHWAF